LLFSRLFT